MAGRSRPLWRTIFDAAEQRVGPATEQLVRTEHFADTVGLISRVNHAGKRRAEQTLRRGWHLFNLPAGSDVKRLSEQVGRLERQVRELRRELDDATREGNHAPANGPAPPRPRRPRQG